MSRIQISILLLSASFLLGASVVGAQDKAPEPTRDRAAILADPTGPYLVGTRTYHWVDKKREEVLTGEKGDKRELMVQIWYPVQKRTQGKPGTKDWSSPYIPGYKTMQPLLRTQYGASEERFGQLQVPAKTDAPLVKSPRRLPLILFSHGLRTARFYYTSQALELASQGYIVVCPDHSYDVEGVAFPKGRLVRGFFDDVERNKAVEAAYRSQDGRIRLWAADLSFVLDLMLKTRKPKKGDSNITVDFPFRGRVDSKRIASMGHCFGGWAALEIGMLDKRIRVVVAENAWPPSSAVRKTGLNKPTLMLYAETDTAEEGLIAKGVSKEQIQKLKEAYLAEQRKGLEAITKKGLQVRIRGAKHMSFSDEFLIRYWMELPDDESPPRPDEHLRLALVYAKAFLDRELRGKKPKLLKQAPNEHEGVEFEDLSETKKQKKTRKTRGRR